MIRLGRLSPGRLILWLLLLAGAAASVVRYAFGLGAVTNLSDRFPWGLWIGFDVMTGVALAAGAFTINATIHIFHLARYRPLLRPAVVTGFLGYLMVILALLVDLGRPYRIWHALIMWNPHSVMFEVAWCVMLYTAVLALEFGQIVLEWQGRTTLLRITQLTLPPLVVAAVILSTLHQSSLGSLFLIAPGKLDPLWYTPFLPVLFFLSSLAVGLAMVTMEAFLSARAFRKTLELPLLVDLGRAAAVVLSTYLLFKVVDLTVRDAWRLVFTPRVESVLFLTEVGLGVITPLVLLTINSMGRSPHTLMASASLIVAGVVLNRLNVAITGMLAGSHASYVPAIAEVLITLAIVAAGVLAYLWIVEHLPVFEAKPVSIHTEVRHGAASPATTPAP